MSSDLPSFSIVIPTHDRPRRLRACLLALAALDYPPERREVIVVDDGGARPAAETVAPLRQRLPITVIRQANGGPALARNTGAAAANGRFLAFTDDDCAPDPGWLRALAACLTAEAGRLAGGRALNGLPANPFARASQRIVEGVYQHDTATRGQPHFFASNNLAAPVEPFRALGGFDPAFRTAEDRDLCDRWRATGLPLAHAPDAIVHHHHDLTLRGFWRQHTGYGRGAYRYHRARAGRGAGPFQPDLAFYLAMARLPLAEPAPRRAVQLAALLALWQLANAAGFAQEALARRGRASPAPRGDGAARPS